MVGAGGGVTVSVGAGDRVAELAKGIVGDIGVEVDPSPSLTVELQPVYKKIKTVKITLENRMGTVRFYRLSDELKSRFLPGPKSQSRSTL